VAIVAAVSTDVSPRRFDLSAEESAAVSELRNRSPSMREVLGILARRPQLAAELVRLGLRGGLQRMRSDPALVWVIDIERIRRVVPDAALGAGWHGAHAFVATLLPHLATEDRVLEVGCGGGRVSRLVAPHVRELVCSDVAEAIVGEARANLADFPNVTCTVTSGFTLDGVDDGSFDAAFTHDVFVQLEPNVTLALLDAIRRKLRTGGIVAASFYTLDRPEWRRDQLELVRDAARRGHFGPTAPQPYVAAQVDTLFATAGFEVVDSGWPTAEHSSGRHYVCVARAAPPAGE
jgi:SAM-dependent methyltransferase